MCLKILIITVIVDMNIKKKLAKAFLIKSIFISWSIDSSLAMENKVKMGGIYDFQAIHYNNNGNPDQRMVSTRNKEFGFYTSGNIFVDYQLIAENGNLYGAKISLEHTSVNDRAVPFFVYIESKLGRVEGGAESSAGKKMRINGYSASCGPGNGWNSRVITSPSNPLKPSEKLIPYITNFCSFLDSKTRTSLKSDYSRKITYFTPKMALAEKHHIQLGISYIPDSSNMGHDDINVDKQNPPVVSPKYKFVIKDGISYGITYTGKFPDKLEAKLSFVGEYGKTHAFNKADNTKSSIKFKNLNTYVIGGILTYEKISFSAAYGNYNKSLTAKEVDLISRDSYVYGYGAKYTMGQYAFSINQFHSNHKKNKLNVTSLGIDYNVAKGLKTYIQTNFYQAKGNYIQEGSNAVKSNKNHGVLTFLGTKISF